MSARRGPETRNSQLPFIAQVLKDQNQKIFLPRLCSLFILETSMLRQRKGRAPPTVKRHVTVASGDNSRDPIT